MIRNRALWRRILVYTGLCLAMGLLQVTLPDSLALWGSRPDLTLVLAVLSGYFFGSVDGFAVGLGAGLMRDLLAGRSLGLGMLLLLYLGLGSAFLFKRLFRRNVFFALIQVTLMTALYQLALLLTALILPFLEESHLPAALLARRLLQALPGQLIVNVLAAVPLIIFLVLAGPYRRNKTERPSALVLAGDGLWHVD